jgi:hypothetical protein
MSRIKNAILDRIVPPGMAVSAYEKWLSTKCMDPEIAEKEANRIAKCPLGGGILGDYRESGYEIVPLFHPAILPILIYLWLNQLETGSEGGGSKDSSVLVTMLEEVLRAKCAKGSLLKEAEVAPVEEIYAGCVLYVCDKAIVTVDSIVQNYTISTSEADISPEEVDRARKRIIILIDVFSISLIVQKFLPNGEQPTDSFEHRLAGIKQGCYLAQWFCCNFPSTFRAWHSEVLETKKTGKQNIDLLPQIFGKDEDPSSAEAIHASIWELTGIEMSRAEFLIEGCS